MNPGPQGPVQFELRIAVMAPEPRIRGGRSNGVRTRHTVDGPRYHRGLWNFCDILVGFLLDFHGIPLVLQS